MAPPPYNQRQKAGGMLPLTVWVPTRAVDYLKIIFGRLADPSDRGEDYRLAASAWLYRRRVPAARFEGVDFAAESTCQDSAHPGTRGRQAGASSAR